MEEDPAVLIQRLQEEVLQLRTKLKKVTVEKDRLEEECDLLAEANVRLREELAKYAVQHEAEQEPVLEDSNLKEDNSHAIVEDELDVFIEGGDDYANRQQKQITNATSGKNVICTAFFYTEEIGQVVFCGGVDATIHGYDPLTGLELYNFKATAPILSLDCFDCCLAAGMMDGSLLLAYITSIDNNPRIITFKDHNKYVISVKWSLDGLYLATAGHDKTVNIYKNK
jgi:hypothetical protein